MALPPPYSGPTSPVPGGIPPMGLPPGYSQTDPRLAPPVLTTAPPDAFVSAQQQRQDQLNQQLAAIREQNAQQQRQLALQQRLQQQLLQDSLARTNAMPPLASTGNPQQDAELRALLGQSDALVKSINAGKPSTPQGSAAESIRQIQKNRAAELSNAHRQFEALGQTEDPQVLSEELDKEIRKIHAEYPGLDSPTLSDHQVQQKRKMIMQEAGIPQPSASGPFSWFSNRFPSQQN